MKKFKISVFAILLAGGIFSFQSCIGSFSLTNSVLNWNKSVGNKFVNELVFFAFWILPVYEVTSLADILILNSIEFWSGKNPMEASVKTVKTDNGNYLVCSDEHGYTIKNEADGSEMRLEFDEATQTWNYVKDGEMHPFMTFVDANHVKMIAPDGGFKVVELSESGVAAYQQEVKASNSSLYWASR